MWSGNAIPGDRTVWSGNRGICMPVPAYDDPGIKRAAGCPAARVRFALCGPTTRRGSVRAALGGAAVVRGPEAGAAATAADRVRVVDREARAHEGVDVVDLAALDERDAVLVDVDADAVGVEDAVLGRGLVLEHHPVAVAGAAARVDVDAQADLRVRLFLGQLGKLRRGSVRERDDRRLGFKHCEFSLGSRVAPCGANTSIVRTSTDFVQHPGRNRCRRAAPLVPAPCARRVRAMPAWIAW